MFCDSVNDVPYGGPIGVMERLGKALSIPLVRAPLLVASAVPFTICCK